MKYDNKKKKYKCPCPEKVCSYPVFARVNGIAYLRIGYTHGKNAKQVIYTRKLAYLRLCPISTCDAK